MTLFCDHLHRPSEFKSATQGYFPSHEYFCDTFCARLFAKLSTSFRCRREEASECLAFSKLCNDKIPKLGPAYQLRLRRLPTDYLPINWLLSHSQVGSFPRGIFLLKVLLEQDASLEMSLPTAIIISDVAVTNFMNVLKSWLRGLCCRHSIRTANEVSGVSCMLCSIDNGELVCTPSLSETQQKKNLLSRN